MLLHISNHQGTHIDAPSHFVPNGLSLDQITPDRFMGRGRVIDLLQDQAAVLKELKELEKLDYVLFWTGWDQYWNTDQYQ